MQFEDYLLMQIAAHPSAGPEDVMKMVYQASFGAEHLLGDETAAKEYFDREYKDTDACGNIPLYEQVSEDTCRVNLAAWKEEGLPAEWLFRIFVMSAVQKAGGCFEENLKQAGQAAADGLLPFAADVWQEYKENYLSEGVRPVHHSRQYRIAEKPAYRLADIRFMRLVPLLKKAADLAAADHSIPVVIAIDGRAASGKTTMADQLRGILGASVVNMDDFFLPPEMRTRQRFSIAGGNVHYERFAQEVLPHLKGGQEFYYRRFDCGLMDFDEAEVKVSPAPWIIVEGSYSHHPELGEYADIKVFSAVLPQIQMERIIKRNGAEMAGIFRERWIPMEEEYFSACSIESKAHYVL